MRPNLRFQGLLFAALLLAAGAACTSSSSPSDDHVVGQTDFTSSEPGGRPNNNGSGANADAGAGGSANANAPGIGLPAPAGRIAEVEEGDIYKLSGTRLFYLNTYRGFLVFDVTDPKQPAQVARLPIYGYPIEMFVEGNVVHALLRDALYLTEVAGKLQFRRHNVSQLVSIDVSNPAEPRVLTTLDITGSLHEGVTRKIDKTIYVVSQKSAWSEVWPGSDDPGASGERRDEAYVYSYDVSDPTNPRQVGRLQIFSAVLDNGRSPAGGIARSYAGVAISATANALLVAERWHVYGVANDRCGGTSKQESVVSLIDVADPGGTIRLHTRFTTDGIISDQFKMTYRSDASTGKGLFYGIVAAQRWTGCSGSNTTNTLETWDVSDGSKPARLGAVDFGKPDETVQGSAFDLSRNVAYAVTSRRIDPMYAIDIADPAHPRVRSAIDGLSGSMSVFRIVGGGKFLLGIGQDQSDSCAGVQDGDPTWRNTKMAVTVLDVNDLDAIKLVQRKCVAIQNAEWVGSGITWNQDQAHKMLGMFQDGDTNILTVPVSYSVKRDGAVGWWWNWQTAVGLLSWDLSQYDPAMMPTQQKVVQSFGSFVHPEGMVTRSILFRHPVSQARTMINVSDTHLSFANIDQLAQPRLESTVEIAPSVSEVHVFGAHVVERVDIGQPWSGTSVAEFRVKEAGGNLNDKKPVATFQVGQATGVYRYGKALVVLRRTLSPEAAANAQGESPVEAVVYDLANPVAPRLASRLAVPFEAYQYYGFMCGVGMGGYWFGEGERTIVTGAGIAQVRASWRQDMGLVHLAFLDLRQLDAPKVHDLALPLDQYARPSLVADPSTADGFYLSRRQAVEYYEQNGSPFTRFRHFAQRFTSNDGLRAGDSINLPGALAKTWVEPGGVRRFLTHDALYSNGTENGRYWWRADARLNLLRQVGSKAELQAVRVFDNMSLESLIIDGSQLYLAGAPSDRWNAAETSSWERRSDRLMILDVGSGGLGTIYDQPTRSFGLALMGVQDHTLFMSYPGDGVLTVDVTTPGAPRAKRFLRTLGWGQHVQFAGPEIYVAAGNFGVFNFGAAEASALPVQQ